MRLSPLHWRIGTYVITAALALYLFAQWQQRRGTENQTVIQRAEQALAMGRSFRNHLDNLKQQVTQRIVTVRVRDTVIVRLDTQLTRDTSARDSVRTLLQKVDTITAQRDSLLSAVRLLTGRAEMAEARASNLEANLRATLAVADCHLLGARWLPRCPSRTAMFIVGAAGGALTYAVVHQ